MKGKENRIALINLKSKNKVGGIILPDVYLIKMAAVIKTVVLAEG